MTAPDVAADLETLRRATVFARGGEGFIQRRSAEASAFARLQPRAAELRDQLQELLHDATPMGRLYAAWLLELIDPELGRAAYEHLTLVDEPVIIHPGGCTPRIATMLSTLAGDALTSSLSEAIERALRRWIALHDTAEP